jgi:hypothetical protein
MHAAPDPVLPAVPLPISATYSQAEVQALRNKCEELADDVRAVATLVHALRTALVSAGLVQGGA